MKQELLPQKYYKQEDNNKIYDKKGPSSLFKS